MSESFKCGRCGGEFLKGRSDEEALAECKREFGDADKDTCVELCDPCYKIFMENMNKAQQGN